MVIGDKVKCSDLKKCEDLSAEKIYTIKSIVTLPDVSDFPLLVFEELPFIAYSIQYFTKIENLTN